MFAVENEVGLRRAGDVNPLIVGFAKNQGTHVPLLALILTALEEACHSVSIQKSLSFFCNSQHLPQMSRCDRQLLNAVTKDQKR